MPKIPIFRLGGAPKKPALPELAASTPSVSLEGLSVGVDNLRHDVILSPRFAEATKAQIARLIARHGELEGLFLAESPQISQVPNWLQKQGGRRAPPKADPAEWKSLLAELHLAALNRVKKEGNNALDLLARLAIVKYLHTEMGQQFNQVVERCRVMLKSYEGIRHGAELQYRERLAAFQVRKKIILRKTGQDLFETLREVEKSTLARTRRSLFGSGEGGSGAEPTAYVLFVNRLMFSEDG